VFLLPVILCLWLLAAVGLDRVLATAQVVASAPRARVAATAIVAVLALALPIGLAGHHGPRVDRSGDRSDGRHVARLVAALPPRAAIASADFIADRMVRYELLGRGAAAARGLALAPRDAPSIAALAASGVQVVAFPGAADRLRLAGLDVSAAPVPLADGPLGGVIAELPRGAIVGLAIPSAHAPALRDMSRSAWRRLRLPEAFGGTATAEHVAVAVAGAAGDAHAISSAGAASVPFDGGGTWRGPVELTAGGGEAAIRAGGRDLIRTSDGAAMAIWTPDGRFVQAFALVPADGYQVPLAITAMTAYPLIGVSEARDVASGADVDVTALAATGSITASVPAGLTLTLDIADAGASAPSVVLQEGDPRVDVQPVPAGGGTGRLTIAAAARQAAVHVVFGAIPDRLTARASGAGTAVVRRASTAGLLRGPDRRSAVVRMTRDDQARLLGAGWSAVETDDAGPYRWTRAREARLVLPAAPVAWCALAIEAFRRSGDGHAAASISVHVNGVALPAQPLRAGWQAYRWPLPPAVAEALTQASAELSVVVDGVPAEHGIAVASLRFSDVD
jgi:hypothetical protein